MKSHSQRPGWNAVADQPRHVSQVVRELVSGLTASLGDTLEGVYLFGSLIAGDFDLEVSDIDLLVAIASDMDDAQLQRLQRLHDSFAIAHPDWSDRIDVSYMSTDALRTFKVRESPIVVVSPGEPLNRKRTSRGWLMNWHLVREHGVALLGPAPRTLIAQTGVDDFVAAVRTHLQELPDRVRASSASRLHAYAVLTACRGLYTCARRQQASKARAALWAADRHPEWSDVIRDSLERRSGRQPRIPDAETARARALEFVRFAVQQSEVASAND
jgi:predicted nucleotidyltransferase